MKLKLTLLFLLFAYLSNAQKITFKAQSKEIQLGDSVLLSWKLENFKRYNHIKIRHLKDSLKPEGSLYVKPKSTKRYYLKVYLGNNKRTYTKSVEITVLSPQILTFKTEQYENTDEDSTVIVWQTSNCNKVVLNDKQDLKLSGRLSFLLKKNTPFKLTVYNKNNISVKKEIIVPIKKIEYLRAKENITIRDTLKIEWSYKECKKIRIKGINKDFKPVGYKLFMPIKDTSYKFTIYRKNGKIDKSRVYVKVHSPVKKFYLSKMVFKNTKARLEWNVDKKFRVEMHVNDTIIRKPYGNMMVDTKIKNSYNLKVYDDKNIIVFDKTKKVESSISPIIRFEVPEVSLLGAPVQIYWKVYKPFNFRIEGIGNNLKHEDSVEVVPVDNIEYKLIVSDKKGKDIDTASRFIEVVKRREFIKNIKDYSELDKKDEISFEIFAIDESKYPNAIKLYVLAVDKQGNFIKGLEKRNKTAQKKIIKEIIDIAGMKKQKVKKFTFEEVQENVSFPYDISMALDYSGSMYGTIDSLEKAVKTFIKNKNKSDKVSLTGFDHNLLQISDLEHNKDSLLFKISPNIMDSLGGCTALYAGSDFAMQSIKSSPNNKILILFTDGMENSSLLYYEKYAFSATTLAKKAKRNKTKVHVVGFGSGVNNRVLRKLAYTTGGNFYKLHFPSDINAVFKELPIILRNFYVITYKPIAKKGEHSVKLVYNNLKGRYLSLKTNYQVGTNFTIKETEPGTIDTYWAKEANKLNKSPISVPQAIAFFDFNKVELKDVYKKSIDSYVNFLKTNTSASIIIMGHTDTKGTDEYCYELGKRRADTIKDYLISKGIDSERINTVSYGKSELIWYPENTAWKANENRRIEFLLVE